MRIYRFTHRKHDTTAWSGQGGLRASGRWHTKGKLVTHASEHAALAVLETLVHATPDELVDFRLHVARIPDEFVTDIDQEALPKDWDQPVHTLSTRALGDQWLSGAPSVGLRVPSSLVPGWNVLLNPNHERFDRLAITGPPIEVNLPSRL